MSDQKIEAPNESDIGDIARALIHADHVISEALGSKLNGSRADFLLIQKLLDAGTVEREATYTLQALGLAFGKVLIEENRQRQLEPGSVLPHREMLPDCLMPCVTESLPIFNVKSISSWHPRGGEAVAQSPRPQGRGEKSNGQRGRSP